MTPAGARHTQKRPPAHGVRKGCQMACVVHFDDDVFAEIRARALRDGTSFGEQVRILVEWGLEEAAEGDGV